MVDILKQTDLEQLIEATGEWCISIYMPAHRAGREQQQDPVRLGNLIDQALEKLLEFGVRRPEVEELMRPAEELLTDKDFWQHQSDGLVIFLSEGFSKILRLPHEFEEQVVVANNFHLKPLLPLLSKDGKFYVMAISMNKVRLLLGTRHTVKPVELAGVPSSMEEALHMDEDPERYTGFHTDASSPGRGRERRAMFYGHGGKSEEEKTNLLRYFQYVDAGLNDLLVEKDIPMVLAGVDYLKPIYHEANTYPTLLEEGLSGNPDDLSEKDLHEAAWKLVEPIYEETQKKDMERFEQFYGQQKQFASVDLKTVVKAAYLGQVETLFVPLGVQRWGRYDPQQHEVILDTKNKPENEDLLNYAVMQTMINSGQIYTVEPEKMPGGSEVAAILRYPADAAGD